MNGPSGFALDGPAHGMHPEDHPRVTSARRKFGAQIGFERGGNDNIDRLILYGATQNARRISVSPISQDNRLDLQIPERLDHALRWFLKCPHSKINARLVRSASQIEQTFWHASVK